MAGFGQPVGDGVIVPREPPLRIGGRFPVGHG